MFYFNYQIGSREYNNIVVIVFDKRVLNENGRKSTSVKTSAMQSYHKTVCNFPMKYK